MTDYLTYQEVCKKLFLFTLQLIYTDQEEEEEDEEEEKQSYRKILTHKGKQT